MLVAPWGLAWTSKRHFGLGESARGDFGWMALTLGLSGQRLPLGDSLGGMTPRLFVSWRGAISAQKDSTGMKGRLARNANIDLGLAILASTSEPPHTSRTIAAYCGCSRQRIQQIEQKALRKLRAALYRNRILKEAFENEFQGLSKKSQVR